MCLGFRVEGTGKVGLVCLQETWATNGMGIIIGVDAASGKDGNVNVLLEADIRQVQRANDIVPDRLLLVILAPVDIGSAR